MTYREAVARILALRGGELTGLRPGLERIQMLCHALGNPEGSYEIVQVGGTNGKGSISAMLASILTAAGRRTGLYTSPHLCSFRERIRVNGAPIPRDDVVDEMEALGTLAARLDASMFETATAIALDHFARERVDVAVLEVGMGGRLDATTVGRPVVEVIARIDYDHQPYLGSTLTDIAREKAAIIRSGTALAHRQAPEVEAVLRQRAETVGIPLLLEGRDLWVEVSHASLEGQRLDLHGPGWQLTDVHCPLLGTFQPSNALLAAGAAAALGIGAGPIRDGLAAARWPGRFHVLPGEPVLVLDGAHNPGGAQALAESLARYFPGQPLTFVIGISADKDAAGILAPLLPLAVRIIFTAASHPRAAAPASLVSFVQPGGALRVDSVSSPTEALALALRPPVSPVICVAGSLFLIGEVLAGRPDAPENLCGIDAPD